MKPIRHILVPTDFAASSAEAVELAITFAKQFDAELTLLHAWELPVYPYMELTMNMEQLTTNVEKAAAECLQTKLNEVKARVPRTKSVLKLGAPWQQIIDAINEVKADLVVMGTHGRRGLSHALMGSVAEKVVRMSPVPVLTTRAPATVDAS